MRILILSICLMSCRAVPAAEQPAALCDAEMWSALVGRSSAAADAIPDPKRILPPGTAITKDLRPQRTNVDLDSDGIILRIWCG